MVLESTELLEYKKMLEKRMVSSILITINASSNSRCSLRELAMHLRDDWGMTLDEIYENVGVTHLIDLLDMFPRFKVFNGYVYATMDNSNGSTEVCRLVKLSKVSKVSKRSRSINPSRRVYVPINRSNAQPLAAFNFTQSSFNSTNASSEASSTSEKFESMNQSEPSMRSRPTLHVINGDNKPTANWLNYITKRVSQNLPSYKRVHISQTRRAFGVSSTPVVPIPKPRANSVATTSSLSEQTDNKENRSYINVLRNEINSIMAESDLQISPIQRTNPFFDDDVFAEVNVAFGKLLRDEEDSGIVPFESESYSNQ
ncbi:hypothetical protein M3Y94_00594500 [Aphelenchoides besseyi]|nr:hypothetical protein M3Y94_00594500 [Aphelenchoides besseyi]KAI6222160.1 hypothetical protein M3Y95_00955200 [Aphelenchoides besseyi]